MRVIAEIAPYDVVHDRYTAYYREGLAGAAERFEEKGGGPFPSALRALLRARESYALAKSLGRLTPAYKRLVDGAARVLGARVSKLEAGGAVARFVISARGSAVRVCVDASDSGRSLAESALDWADCYFKTSFLKDHVYPAKVLPLWQCSYVLLGRLGEFRALRTVEKEYDLCFTTRVWGGTNDVEGIEHNLRILEALSKLRCRKYLRAYLLAGDREAAARRLEARGIPWSFDPLPFREHLRVLAASRMNVHRLGMHNSITWRMTELMSLGACPVLDQAPRTLWPQPLCDGANYLTLGVIPEGDSFLAPDSAYDAIPEKVEYFLLQPGLLDGIAAANSAYFDRFLEPSAVGRYILEQAGRARVVPGEPSMA
jgi:hypothetical protein